MMQRLTVPTILAVLMFSPQTGHAADADNGARLAQLWCASCHVIAKDQRRASADAAPFHEIAARPNFDEEKVAAFLVDPHPKMPSMSLSRIEAADLAAYIATQK